MGCGCGGGGSRRGSRRGGGRRGMQGSRRVLAGATPRQIREKELFTLATRNDSKRNKTLDQKRRDVERKRRIAILRKLGKI